MDKPANKPGNVNPGAEGYAMPPEWEKHAGTWLAWPHNEEQWPDLIAHLEDLYTLLIREISRGEAIYLLITESNRERVLSKLVNSGMDTGRIKCFDIPTADIWIRDYGPTFLTKTSAGGTAIAYVNWQFNAWGGKYSDLAVDRDVGHLLSGYLCNAKRFEAGFFLEGGAIDVNGSGVCLTTEQCLLNPNRNPGMDKNILEDCLRRYLGVEKIVWLAGGLIGDDTDGHIDTVARFVNRKTIVTASADGRRDPNYKVLKENIDRLKKAVDSQGAPFEIIPLPPAPKLFDEGAPLPANYLNFYIANKSVLVPSFGTANDREVTKLMAPLFPGRDIVMIDCKKLFTGQGAFHCITQQQPLGSS